MMKDISNIKTSEKTKKVFSDRKIREHKCFLKKKDVTLYIER